MDNADNKIECVKKYLIEDLEIGKETNTGFNKKTEKLSFLSRKIDRNKICEECDLTFNQFDGILDWKVPQTLHTL